jgi:predicted dehydrogenase
LALSGEELDRVLDTVDATGNDRILVGFNRRYAPLLVEMRARFGDSSEPTNSRYLVNAGRLASDSWYRDRSTEGSRFVGEGGHFVDTLSWWMGSSPVEVVTMPAAGPDELQMSLRYPDGSLATITYLTNAHRRFPKETFEVSANGRSARLDNFKRITMWLGTRARVRRHLGPPDKGQSAQIQGFLDAVRCGGPMPISLESLTNTTRVTLTAAHAGTGCTTTQL